jgi:hypothetical protein
VILSNEVERDEAYAVAGHKGQPEVIKSTGRKGRRRRRKSKAGRGTMAKESKYSIIPLCPSEKTKLSPKS